jgi:hypothetical protein
MHIFIMLHLKINENIYKKHNFLKLYSKYQSHITVGVPYLSTTTDS